MGTSADCCIVVCREQPLIDVLEKQGETLVVAGDDEAGIEAVRAHPDQPVLVDVAEFPQWPKLLRMRETDQVRPGLVIGYAPPVRQDLLEEAELFCDDVVPRPKILRNLPELLEGARGSGCGSGNCGCS
jgi:hypothetical protein